MLSLPRSLFTMPIVELLDVLRHVQTGNESAHNKTARIKLVLKMLLVLILVVLKPSTSPRRT